MQYLAWLAILCACGDNAGQRPMPDGPAIDSPASDGPPGDAATATCTPTSGTRGTTLQWRFVASTDGVAIIVVSPPHDPRRFVVEQQGRIKQVGGPSLAAPFLDLSNLLVCCGERGLLGLAFDPHYAQNGRFYVYYTTDTQDILARYSVDPTNPDRADPDSATILLAIDHPESNHHAGMLEFGPDGDLYLTTGDGGGAGDPFHSGQNKHTLLAKLLRIDPSQEANGKHYAIPPTNPYADGVDGAPEVFHYGFRNPWRWAFDKLTGDLWIGDVGQGDYEELDLIAASTAGGLNFGWSLYEGDHCYNNGNGNGTCSPAGITLPQFEASHPDGWCAIIGGDVYRGQCFPDLVGTYLFTDYCKAELYTATKTGTATFTTAVPTVSDVEGGMTYPGSPPGAASLHAAADGDLYLTTTSCCGNPSTGGIYRLEVVP
jgi:glucose/arabinose dehydrogenase